MAARDPIEAMVVFQESGQFTDPTNKTFQLYKLEVVMNGSKWHILRRYSMMHELSTKLTAAGLLTNVPFPPKIWFGNLSPEVVSQRKEMFQAYFNAITDSQQALTVALEFFKPIRTLSQVCDLKTRWNSATSLTRVTIDPFEDGDVEFPPLLPPSENHWLVEKLNLHDEITILQQIVKFLKEKWTVEEVAEEEKRISEARMANPSAPPDVPILPSDIRTNIEQIVLVASERRLQSLKPT